MAVNFAENQRRWDTLEGITAEDCRRQGITHADYGWSPVCPAHWPAEFCAAYMEGFNDAYKAKRDKVEAIGGAILKAAQRFAKGE